jgi:signal transduction histidine kinase
MHLKITAPHLFALLSSLLIVGVTLAIGMVQSSFYEQAIIERESHVIRDMVQALVAGRQSEGQLSLNDLEQYDTRSAQARLGQSFRGLTNVMGKERIKVFNRNGTIAWSDDPQLIGSPATRHTADLAHALRGDVRAILFNPTASPANPLDVFPDSPLIEFYVPFSLGDAEPPGAISGALALYRSSEDLTSTLARGNHLLWTAKGIGGVILFAALYALFHWVYYGKREAESQLARLSAEHARMMQLERLSAMGQMVSEIAHQLNNPLVGVINLTQLAEREIHNPERMKELLGEVRKAGADCRGFVQSMLVLNKVSRAEPHLTDMTRLVQDTIAFFQRSLGGQPRITVEAPPAPVMLEADPVLIRNALFNLVHNAAQADPSGHVTVSLALAESGGERRCSLSVADCGPGLSPDVQNKLFTPFFTTRAGGTGLGLSVAKHIAVLHGGGISADNRAGGGACFVMSLPARA